MSIKAIKLHTVQADSSIKHEGNASHIYISAGGLELSIVYDKQKKGFLIHEASAKPLTLSPQAANSFIIKKG
jgi:hypothetical protein